MRNNTKYFEKNLDFAKKIGCHKIAADQNRSGILISNDDLEDQTGLFALSLMGVVD